MPLCSELSTFVCLFTPLGHNVVIGVAFESGDGWRDGLTSCEQTLALHKPCMICGHAMLTSRVPCCQTVLFITPASSR